MPRWLPALPCPSLSSFPIHSVRRTKRSRVAILHVEEYSQRIDQILASGLQLFRINVQGKTVVLKPNLVDYIPGNAVNTHPILVLAAAESFRRMGAKCVIVAEGPDTSGIRSWCYRRAVIESLFAMRISVLSISIATNWFALSCARASWE